MKLGFRRSRRGFPLVQSLRVSRAGFEGRLSSPPALLILATYLLMSKVFL